MTGRVPTGDEREAGANTRLESWKEIASYLRRGVRTVRRWEKQEGLPVHRQMHTRLGTVSAYTRELDAWRSSREAAGAHPRARRPFDAPRVMVAILPFGNLSGDPEQEYVADGLTEEIIGQLAGIDPGRLGVIARTTVMQYKGAGRTVRQIGRELNVDYVVEGAVRRERSRMRVTVQLVHAGDQAHVWSGTRERVVGSLLSLQRDLADDICREIRARLSSRPRSAPGPGSHDAYHAYLKGRYLLNRFTPGSVRQAAESFGRAIEADPSFAPAHAGLAVAYERLPMWLEVPPSNTLPLAKAAAEQALRLDPDLAEAHASLGLIHANYLWEWSAAEQHFRRALALNPSSSQARHWFVEFLAEMGRIDDALETIEPARTLDPLSSAIQAARAFALLMGRRYDEAIRQANLALEIDPGYPMALIRKGLAAVCSTRHAEGIRALEQAAEAAPEMLLCQSLLGYAHARGGNRREAEVRLDLLRSQADSRYVPAFLFANVHVGLGDHEEALTCIEREYDSRGWYLVLLKQAPQFDPLRSHPRFRALLRRMKFPA